MFLRLYRFFSGRARLFAAGRAKLRPSPSPQRHQAINPLLHGIAAREPRGYSWEREKDPFQSGRQQLTEYQWMSERTWMGAGMDGCTLVLLHATHCSRIKRWSAHGKENSRVLLLIEQEESRSHRLKKEKGSRSSVLKGRGGVG